MLVSEKHSCKAWNVLIAKLRENFEMVLPVDRASSALGDPEVVRAWQRTGRTRQGELPGHLELTFACSHSLGTSQAHTLPTAFSRPIYFIYLLIFSRVIVSELTAKCHGDMIPG